MFFSSSLFHTQNIPAPRGGSEGTCGTPFVKKNPVSMGCSLWGTIGACLHRGYCKYLPKVPSVRHPIDTVRYKGFPLELKTYQLSKLITCKNSCRSFGSMSKIPICTYDDKPLPPKGVPYMKSRRKLTPARGLCYQILFFSLDCLLID